MITRLRFLSAGAIVALGLLAPLRASASPVADATAALKDGVNEVLDTIYRVQKPEELAAAIRPILEKHFLFEVTTRLAIGPGWRQFTPDQRARATSLFTDLIIKTYQRRMTGDERPQITYLAGTELSSDKVELPTTVTYAGHDYSVTYRMTLDSHTDTWRIYDVIIEGVSMVANYRAQFNALYNRGGAEEIIKSLEAKAKEPPPAS